jgi:hypothetical protein
VIYRRELRPVITTGAEVIDQIFRSRQSQEGTASLAGLSLGRTNPAGPGDRQADRTGGPGPEDQRGDAGQLGNAHRRRRDGSDGALSGDERTELVRLRNKNAELTMERDALKQRGASAQLTGTLLP